MRIRECLRRSSCHSTCGIFFIFSPENDSYYFTPWFIGYNFTRKVENVLTWIFFLYHKNLLQGCGAGLGISKLWYLYTFPEFYGITATRLQITFSVSLWETLKRWFHFIISSKLNSSHFLLKFSYLHTTFMCSSALLCTHTSAPPLSVSLPCLVLH